MKVTVTGGAGFLGRKLAARLLRANGLRGRDGRPAAVERLILADAVAPPEDLAGDPRVTALVGDITDPELLRRAVPGNTDSVFHLAAVVSAGAEEDFDLGMGVNLDATRALLELCRAHGTAPRLLFASSAAAFGGNMPAVIADMTAPTPQTSYGTQKVIGELLVHDYSRRGFIDGRSLRFPTVVVRPGRPNRAASTFASSIIREPLQGERAVCPVAPEARMWLASPRAIIDNLIHAHDLPAAAWGASRTVSLPGFSATIAEMASALASVAGQPVADRIDWVPDPFIQAIVAGWPPAFDTARALAMGFRADRSMQEVIRAFITDELDGQFTP